MTTTAQPRLPTTARSLDAVLLARRGEVFPPASEASATPEGLAGVALLETDLLRRGHLLSAPLRTALAACGSGELRLLGEELLAALDAELGADRDHTPLFRRFPDSVPADTAAFFADRVLTLLLQHPEQPCVLCGEAGTVHAVAPCAHLVCRTCFDGADFSACPVCHRALDPGDPFLRPAADRPALPAGEAAPPQRARVLQLGGTPEDRADAAGEELRRLLERTTALSPQDADDLAVLLDTRSRTDLDWLPAHLPGRETKARVLAWLLEDPETRTHTPVLSAVTGRLDTATDVLRLLAVRSGGDAGLTKVPRLAPVPRPVRCALLAALDRLDPAVAVAEMRRRRRAFTGVLHGLHPFAHAARFPRAALAAAALRRTPLDGDALGERLRAAAAETEDVAVVGGRVVVSTWGGRLEAALSAGDVADACALLARRPGELVRRLDHLLRLAGPDASTVLAGLGTAVPRVAPAVLLSALGALRSHDRQAARVFFPKGADARAHVADDLRGPLPPASAEAACAVLGGELLRRAAALPRTELAVLDAALDDVVAPFTERTASRALVTLPRGSELALPEGRVLRLFLHWTESPLSGRTDLDLSLALFDDGWSHVGTCDYTHLRFAGKAAVHSGDLTSAPAPRGASEFVDLHLERLREAGVRYAVATVFSYNGVPFTELADAFAGFMVRPGAGRRGPAFDPRTVEQRFDLTGTSRACVPLVVDVQAGTMRWLDVVQDVTGTHHAVHRHADRLALLGSSLTGLFASGARVGMGELAAWHAAARAAQVAVRHSDGSLSLYRRHDAETVAEFAARLGTPDRDACGPVDTARAGLAFTLRSDLPLADDATVHTVHPGTRAPATVRSLTEAVDALAAS